jgi:hypothetical protein
MKLATKIIGGLTGLTTLATIISTPFNPLRAESLQGFRPNNMPEKIEQLQVLPPTPAQLAQNNICLQNGMGIKSCSINGVNVTFKISDISACGPKNQGFVLDIESMENTSRDKARLITIFGLDSSDNRVEQSIFQLNPYKLFKSPGEIYLCIPNSSGGVEIQ